MFSNEMSPSWVSRFQGNFGSYLHDLGSSESGTMYKTSKRLAIKKYLNTDGQISRKALNNTICLKYLRNSSLIVSILGFQYNSDESILAMDLGCGNLNDLLDTQRYSVKHLSLQIVLAIEACHRHQIVHRDLRPENIIWFPGNNLKLTNFGSADVSGGEMRDFNTYHPAYRAPEVFLKMKYTMKADIWAVGCVLGEIIIKSQLFELGDLKGIFEKLGTPQKNSKDERLVWPEAFGSKLWSPKFEGFRLNDFFVQFQEIEDLLRQMFTYDPNKRPDVFAVLEHPYFNEKVQRSSNTEVRKPKKIFRNFLGINTEQIFHLTTMYKIPLKVAYDTIHLFDDWYNRQIFTINFGKYLLACFRLMLKFHGYMDSELFELTNLVHPKLNWGKLEKKILENVKYQLIITTAYDVLVSQLNLSKSELDRELLNLRSAYCKKFTQSGSNSSLFFLSLRV